MPAQWSPWSPWPLQAGAGRSPRDGRQPMPLGGLTPEPLPLNSTRITSLPTLQNRENGIRKTVAQGFWVQFRVDQGSPDAPIPHTTPQPPATLPETSWKPLSRLPVSQEPRHLTCTHVPR